MENSKKQTLSIKVDPFNTDFAKRWSWMSLGKTLLNAAELHAKNRGFGMYNVNSEKYSVLQALGAAGLHAALAHARHNGGDLLRHVLPAGDVVQEEERLGPADDHVVDAHGHAVDAHSVVLVLVKGQLELGAHAVGAGHQHGLLHALHVQLEQPAKAAHAAEGSRCQGAGDMAFHQLHGLVARSDIHAGGFIGFRIALHSSGRLSLFLYSNRDLARLVGISVV